MEQEELSPQEKALLSAAKKGATEQVRKLLNNGTAVDCRNDHEDTPLMLAALGGHLSTVELLLQRGAMLDAYNRWDMTPYLCACCSGDITLIKLLLARGANAYAQSVEMDRALYYAARHDSPELVDLLAPFSDLPWYEWTGGGGSALAQSCKHGNLKTAKHMLEWGISPNARGDCGEASALAYACSSGNLELVKMLLAEGADPMDRGYGEQHPIGSALDADPFNPAIAELMLKLGNNINLGEEDWGTPLERAREHGTEEAVAWALAHGAKAYADLTEEDRNKAAKAQAVPARKEQEPLPPPYLRIKCDSSLIPAKREYFFRRSHSGWTALMTAIGDKDINTITAILQAGQRPNGSNIWAAHVKRILGRTIKKVNLHRIANKLCADWAFLYTGLYEGSEYCVSSLTRACSRLDERAVKILLELGVNVNSRDRFTYRTPLFAVCSPAGDELRPALVKILLTHGADVTAEDDFQQTALHALCMLPFSKEREQVKQLLIQAGADAGKKDIFGKTAEDYELNASHQPRR